MRVEWSAAALADLDRFAAFLHDRFPALAGAVAREIVTKTRLLEDNPQVGHLIAGRGELRQVVLQVLNAAYVLQYRIDGGRVVILRVFHGREWRGPLPIG